MYHRPASHNRDTFYACVQLFETVSVPVHRFVDQVLDRGASYRDVIRVFLKHGGWMSDDDVDDLIASRVMVTSHADDEIDGDDERRNDIMAAESRHETVATSGESKYFDESENRLVGKNESFRANRLLLLL